MIQRVIYQSKTLSNILSWLITLLFNLIGHSNTILASPGTLNEVEVPSKQPQAGASAFEPRKKRFVLYLRLQDDPQGLISVENIAKHHFLD